MRVLLLFNKRYKDTHVCCLSAPVTATHDIFSHLATFSHKDAFSHLRVPHALLHDHIYHHIKISATCIIVSN